MHGRPITSPARGVLVLLVLGLPALALRNPTLPCPNDSPLVSLEHVNVNVAKVDAALYEFWHAMGLVPDPRADAVTARVQAAGGAMERLVWMNCGYQQFHLPLDPSSDYQTQRIRGHVGLDYPSLAELRERLHGAGIDYTEKREEGGHLVVMDPAGNEIRCYEQDQAISPSYLGPANSIPPDAFPSLPGGRSLCLGMRYVSFNVPIGVADTIGAFYSHYFHGATTATALVGEGERAVVDVQFGHHQYLRFEEVPAEQVPPYDLHHVAIYINDFPQAYERLKADNLIYHNPRFPQFNYSTLEHAMSHSEFRFITFTNPTTHEVVYELEHEVRSLDHPGFSCRSWLEPDAEL